jgi:phosphatidylinositol alpha 1,6-mannosyltransferase
MRSDLALADPQRLTVALVAETFRPAVNGVVNSVLRAADHLAVRGHEPVVIAPSGSSYESRCGARIEVVAVPSMRLPLYRGLELARPFADLDAALRDVGPDVLHLASPAVLGAAAARSARRAGIPSVAVFQTDLAAFARRYRVPGGVRGAWRLLRRVHRMADLTLAPSTVTAALLARHRIGPVALWQRGVDLEQFSPRWRSAALRAELAADGELLVGALGRLAPEKRLELLEPVSRLPGVRLVLIGSGPLERQLASRLPRAWLLGQRTGADLGAVVASLDLLAHPGADETFGQAVQEALAAGVPALVAASGGVLDLVRHNDNGWLWAGGDPEVLAAMVADLRDHPTVLHAAAGRARGSVSARTWGRIGDELIGHYRSVLGLSDGGVTDRPVAA